LQTESSQIPQHQFTKNENVLAIDFHSSLW
jgi:hypothetical protein